MALVHTHAAHFVTVMAGGVKLNEYLLAGQPMKALIFIATRPVHYGCPKEMSVESTMNLCQNYDEK